MAIFLSGAAPVKLVVSGFAAFGLMTFRKSRRAVREEPFKLEDD